MANITVITPGERENARQEYFGVPSIELVADPTLARLQERLTSIGHGDDAAAIAADLAAVFAAGARYGPKRRGKLG